MANRYWVGGSGTWGGGSTTNWASTSGGSPGATEPTTADNVFFDSNSGSGAVVDVYTTASIGNLTTTGFSGTILSTTQDDIRVFGNTVLSATTTLGNGVSGLVFQIPTGTHNITSNGATINVNLWLREGTLVLQDTYTGTKTSTTTSGSGTLNLNNQTFICGGLNNLDTVTVNFSTSGKIVTWGVTGTSINALLISGSSPLIEIYAPSTGETVNVGGHYNENDDAAINTAYNTGLTTSIIANPSGVYGGTAILNGGIVNLNIGNFAIDVRPFVSAICGNLTLLGSNPTFIEPNIPPEYVNAVKLIASTSMISAGTVRIITSNGGTFGILYLPDEDNTSWIFGQSGGVWRCGDDVNAKTFRLWNGTLNLNGRTLTVGTFTSNLSNGTAYNRTIQFNGGVIKVTSSFDTSSPTNLSLSGTPDIRMAIPTSGSTVSFNSGSLTTYNVSTVSNLTGGTASLTGSVNNLTLANIVHTVNGTFSIYGDFTASGNNVTSASGTWTFAATSGTKTISANNATFNNAWTFNGVGGTWQLSSALNIGSASTLTLTNGTLNFNSQDVSIGTFSSSNTNGRTLTIGDSTVNITGSGTAWNTATSSNLTVNYGAAARISMNSASAKTFAGGGKTWPTVNQGGAGTLSVTGNNTFTNFTNTVTGCTISFPSGTTTFTAFSIRGVFGSPVTLSSTSTLSKASGTVAVNYLNLSNSTATGGAQWYAGAGSTDGGGNTGWIFSTASTGGFLAFF